MSHTQGTHTATHTATHIQGTHTATHTHSHTHTHTPHTHTHTHSHTHRAHMQARECRLNQGSGAYPATCIRRWHRTGRRASHRTNRRCPDPVCTRRRRPWSAAGRAHARTWARGTGRICRGARRCGEGRQCRNVGGERGPSPRRTHAGGPYRILHDDGMPLATRVLPLRVDGAVLGRDGAGGEAETVTHGGATTGPHAHPTYQQREHGYRL